LWGLQTCGLPFEMKGGTSLSKGWGCIDRFSEDIDLRFEVTGNLNERGEKPAHVEARRSWFDGLASEIRIPGVVVERNRAYDDDKARNGGISLRYKSLFMPLPELRPEVLLEAGFTQTAPNEPRDFTSWVWERAAAANLEIRDNRALAVPCFNPEYTFVDKLQTICRRFRQYTDRKDAQKDRARQFLRHYYDLYKLLQMQRVRDFIGTREYAAYVETKIKGLDRSKFINQLDYFDQHYTFVRMEDCIEAVYGESTGFPDDALLLTFDDGYLEHYTEVFPILDERGIQGSFFPPVQSTLEEKVLDVNKIHFILASTDKPGQLLRVLTERIQEYRNEFDLSAPEEYYERIDSSEHPYDPLEVIIFKRVLQRELPLEAREMILSDLFEEYVGVSESVFSNELYMNEDQLRTMIRCGMFVGGHGYSHTWLNSIGPDEQKKEVALTDDFLDYLGPGNKYRVMCYPYGAYDAHLIGHLKENRWLLGLSTKSGVAELKPENAFELERMDTNEFPA
jgi:peptidoglycan/xylan/chitin deacetylase (PgdA/CDA1 family)